jgi:hypothetical protein
MRAGYHEVRKSGRLSSLLLRTIRLSPLVACLFAGCTCFSEPAREPVPTPTPIMETLPTATLPPHTPTQPVPTPADSPTPDLAAVGAKRAECDGYLAVLSGRKEGSSLADEPELRHLAESAPDLVICAAVKGDSEAVLLADCLYLQAMFHELRTYPKGRSFMFTGMDYKQCMDRSVCDALRDALRSGDPKKCAQVGDGESICLAFMNLDKSLCRIPEGAKGGGEQKEDEGGVEELCRQTIESRAFLAQGLEALAESGEPRHRELARAALGREDACTSLARAAMDTCMEFIAPVADEPAAAPTPAKPVADPPVSETAVPGSPAAAAPMPEVGDTMEAPAPIVPSPSPGQS